MYSFSLVLMLASAGFFYHAGEQARYSGFVWASLSVLVSVAMIGWFGGGFLAVLGGQLAYFLALTLFRCWKEV